MQSQQQQEHKKLQQVQLNDILMHRERTPLPNGQQHRQRESIKKTLN